MDFSCLCEGEGRERLLEAEKERMAAQPWRIRPSIRFSFSFHENSPLNNDHRRTGTFAPFLISSCYVTASTFAFHWHSRASPAPNLAKKAYAHFILIALDYTRYGCRAQSTRMFDNNKPPRMAFPKGPSPSRSELHCTYFKARRLWKANRRR